MRKEWNALAKLFLSFNVILLFSVYSLSLVATFISLFLMDSAQPALLYIVPCTLLPIMLTACARGEFKDMWDGDRETQLVSE